MPAARRRTRTGKAVIDIVAPSLYLLAGIAAYGIAQHRVFARVAANRTSYLLFSGMCLAAMLVALFGARIIHAPDDASFIVDLRANISASLLLAVLHLWFIIEYTGKKTPILRGAATLALTVCLLANYLRPWTLQYDAFTGIEQLRLPWGETITRGTGRNGPWAWFTVAAVLGVFGFAIYALADLYRRTRRRTTLWLLAATSLFAVTAVEGVLVRLSLLHVFPMGPFGFLVMIVVMGATLGAEVQQQLRSSEANFRSILRNASDGIHVLDGDGTLIEASNTFCDMLGYRRDELIGMKAAAWDPQFSPAAFADLIARELTSPARTQIETRHRRKNGSLIEVEVTRFPLELNGRPVMFNASRDITERKASHSRIQHLAFFDQLTDLPNRRLLDDKLGQILALSAHTGHYSALLMIDLDNFKTINDSVGHLSGDQVLTQIAQRLSAVVRKSDTVARLGGDEFVVLLSDLDAERDGAVARAKAVGDKILRALSRPYQLGSREFRSSCSVGATVFNGDRLSPEELIKQADIAMYQAKNAGRNTLRFFDPQMQVSINSRAALQNDLHKAIEGRQFELHYQLQVDRRGRPAGTEALLRWRHPQRGLVPPMQFIALAEETGLISPIGRWALETACSQLLTWRKDPNTRDLSIAINVSSKQLRSATFLSQVRTAVRSYGIDPRLLKLELTESMLLHDIEDTITTMNDLKTLGVSFSLDDFGTGYSSLQYLKRLPLDELKIDRSFVRDIAADPSDHAIVRTIVAIAHAFNMRVIAEGVETDEQRRLLADLGCTHFQGYLFAPPLPAADVSEIMGRPEATDVRPGLVPSA